jgi:hypothetical protein
MLKVRAYDFMARNQPLFEHFVVRTGAVSFQEFVAAQKKKGTWKNDTAVSVFAHEAKVNVIVFSSNSASPTLSSPATVTLDTPVIVLLLSHYHGYSKGIPEQELSHYYHVKFAVCQYEPLEKLLLGFCAAGR